MYQSSTAERRANHARLQAVLARVEAQIPGARRATDSAGRETDIAIDHSEFTQLPPQAIDAVVALMQAEGLRATVSSIHVNGWIGDHSKWTAAQWMLERLFGRPLAPEIARFARPSSGGALTRTFSRSPSASVQAERGMRAISASDVPPSECPDQSFDRCPSSEVERSGSTIGSRPKERIIRTASSISEVVKELGTSTVTSRRSGSRSVVAGTSAETLT